MGERSLYWKLTGRENLEFFGALYHLPPAARKQQAQQIIDRLNLGEIADRPVETYSSGQKMKLAFGKALIPESVRFLSHLIPLSYCVDAFRSTLMGYPNGFPELASIEVELIIVTLFGIFMPLVGYWLYRRAEDRARVRGSLAEY